MDIEIFNTIKLFKFKQITKLVVLFAIFFFSAFYSFSQIDARTRMEALYIYNFAARYFSWKNIDEVDTFKVAVLGVDEFNFTREFSTIASARTILNKPVKVVRYDSLDDLSNSSFPQILFLLFNCGYHVDDVDSILNSFPTLIISEAFPFGESMINFVREDTKLKFEMNEPKCLERGITPAKEIKKLAIGTEQEWNSILRLRNEK